MLLETTSRVVERLVAAVEDRTRDWVASRTEQQKETQGQLLKVNQSSARRRPPQAAGSSKNDEVK